MTFRATAQNKGELGGSREWHEGTPLLHAVLAVFRRRAIASKTGAVRGSAERTPGWQLVDRRTNKRSY